MATKQQIIDYLKANPNLSDAQLVAYMAQNQISPAQLAEASGAPVGQISAQIAATIPPGNSVTLGDTRITPQYQTIGSGMDQQIGGLENVYLEKTTGDINYKAPVGSEVQVLSPTGEFINTIKTKEELSFFGGLADAFKDPVVLAALGGAYAGGLFGGAGTAATAAGTAGMSAAELASYDMALGGLGGTAGGASLVGGATIPTISSLTGGSGLLTGQAAGITAESVAKKLADDAIAQGLLTNTGNTALNTLGTKTAAELAAEKLATDTAAKTAITAGTKTAAEIAAEELAKKTATSVLVNEVTKAINPNTVSGLLQTGGSLLQSKESKAAAEQAARDITTATQAGVAGSQFRPVGMTTRFGTSQYKYDPVTGQMISAGYQLTPEAKAQQDRFAKMANYSLTQAENAQSQFNPLQAGAANLFTLGNKYIEKTPESVAQTYIDQQMALLKPSREVELANLQNRLQQQGRLGLSVAQGGSMGATTPELQALYNARAQQEAVLAANAQQAGQQSVLFGAGLLGQGSQALGQYYGGQVAAYQPYQAAMGQVQNLESLGQQPLQMGATLGQQSATAGANAGRLGLAGAQIAGGFNTSANATFNPYAGLLTAAGSPSSMFGQSIAKYLSGGSVTPFDALSSTKYGDGLAGYEKMIQDIYGT